jgi:hypothetical protein
MQDREITTMQTLRTALAILILVCVVAAGTPARADERLPIFDAHVHYNAPAWQAFDPPYVREVLDKAGIVGALVSSTPEEGTLKLFEADPKRIVPEFRPYRDQVLAATWTGDAKVVDYIRERLPRAPYVGIGEIHIYRMRDVDWDVIARVAAMAREKNVLLHVHSEAPAIERIFALEPGLTILWAHAGFYDDAETIGAMLDKYDGLHAELSLRAPNIMPVLADDIAADWKAVFLRHPGRFVIGSDTYINLAWAEYGEIIAAHRRWLDRLPRDVAERIAHKNAMKLFSRTVTD